MFSLMPIAPAICAVVALLAFTPAATARQITTMHIGNWEGGAYVDDQNRFTHCVANARYRSGLFMFISVTRSYRWYLGFYNPDWHLKEGGKFNVLYRIDQSPWERVPAEIAGDGLIKIQMENETPLIRLFRRGRLMEVNAVGQSMRFSLEGTSVVLPALVNCVEGQHALTQPQRPPPSSPPPSTNVDALKSEAVRIASNFLLDVRLPGARLLSPDDIPAKWRHQGAIWAADGIIGTVDIYTGTSIDKAIAHLIGEDALACEGSFASGRLPSPSQPDRPEEVFTSCRGNPNLNIRYLLSRRQKGGYYQFAIISSGENAQADIPTDVREAVYHASR